jgi:hypothetical protein
MHIGAYALRGLCHERQHRQPTRNVTSHHLLGSSRRLWKLRLECDICLETYIEGDRLGRLPCSHRFHVGCIHKWIGDDIRATCLECREFVWLPEIWGYSIHRSKAFWDAATGSMSVASTSGLATTLVPPIWGVGSLSDCLMFEVILYIGAK